MASPTVKHPNDQAKTISVEAKTIPKDPNVLGAKLSQQGALDAAKEILALQRGSSTSVRSTNPLSRSQPMPSSSSELAPLKGPLPAPYKGHLEPIKRKSSAKTSQRKSLESPSMTNIDPTTEVASTFRQPTHSELRSLNESMGKVGNQSIKTAQRESLGKPLNPSPQVQYAEQRRELDRNIKNLLT